MKNTQLAARVSTMQQIPMLNGRFIGEPISNNQMASNYYKIIMSIFLPRGVDENTPEFQKTYPIGFLLFTNAHPEFRNFMTRPDTWSFLDSLTGRYLYVFSHKLEPDQKILSKEEENTMIELLNVFDINEISINPYLVLCDFQLHYRKGDARWQNIYDAKVLGYAALKIENFKEDDHYINAFRNSLSGAIKPESPNVQNPARRLAERINWNQLKYNSYKALRQLVDEDFAKKFAAAWTLLSWRPNTILV